MSDVAAVKGAQQQRHLSTVAMAGIGAAASFTLVLAAWSILTTDTYAWILGGLVASAGFPVALIDVRTHKLPNRYVAPIAAAGIIQAAAIAFASTDLFRLLVPMACGAVVFSAYAAMGMAGWFGFGDAKFAAALTVTVAITSGITSVLIVSIAVLIGGVQRVLDTILGYRDQVHAHGPALVLAATAILSLTFASAL
jgi:leader peptidase (prepilin peptidase) / N-methyltransferase